jgi:5-methyltetrahydrofolate--homocysteine methyltransferase
MLWHDSEHIALIAARVKDSAARITPAIETKCRLSGLEALDIGAETLFVNVGECTNVTGSAKFRKLIEAGDYSAALDVARQQVEAGAQIIDVNMDEGMLDSAGGDGALPEPRRSGAGYRPRARSMIDSSKW